MKIGALFLSATLLSSSPGCSGSREEAARPVSVSLNAAAMAFLINTAQRQNASSESRMRLDAATVTAFVPPNSVQITARSDSASPNNAPDRYDLAFTQDNHIVRARITSATRRGFDVNSPLAQRFAESLSRAVTTYALKDHSDGGITAVYVENSFLIVDVQSPLR